MYHQGQQYGHFGAPEYLGSPTFPYESNIVETAQQLVQSEEDRYATSEQPLFDFTNVFQPSVSTPLPAYLRSGQALPMLEDGATDALVKQVTGIQGLVTEVQKRMKLQDKQGIFGEPTGTLSKGEIQAYQASKGLKQDGIIGPNTYKKLGLSAPYQGGSSSSSSRPSSGSTSMPTPIGGKPWYLGGNQTVNYIVVGVLGLAILGYGGTLIYRAVKKDEQ